MTDDIVARLRMYANASLDGDWATFFRSDLNAAAAEIERLCNERNAFEAERDELIRISDKLKHERDEARRRICDDAIRHGLVYRRVGSNTVRCENPKEVAEMMGWDCFKQDLDDR